tara:strand:+ start:512 stop:1303 length:792 start_codon:yes stop_codon:yes gene_type:complete
MEIKKPFIFLKALPKKLNRFFIKKSRTSLVINNKSKNLNIFNPVTNFDKSFEKLIRSLIIRSFPKHGIIGEEFKDKNSTNNYNWLIDPIDGTKAFVIGVPTWSNLIGLMYKKESIVGLANFPELNKYYISDKKRTYLFKDKKRFIINCSKKYNLKKIKVIGNFHGYINNKNKFKIIKKLGQSFRPVSFDALSYCLLAEGKIDAVIETNLKSFDIMPLIPIIKNAGGCVSNWKGNSAEKGGNIVASSNRKLHEKILKILNNFKT